MGIVIAQTDVGWYEFLRARYSGGEEVIFWTSTIWKEFENFKEGDLWLFRLKGRKNNEIGGFGLFSKHGSGEIKDIWDKYKLNLGYESLQSICLSLSKRETDTIGYAIIKDVCFFSGNLPKISIEKFHPKIQKCKYYKEENDVKNFLIW